MEIKQLDLVFFSPTGTTQRILEAIAEQFPLPRRIHNLTPLSSDAALPSIPADSLLLIGAPVYGGRIPQVFRQRLEALRGEGGPAVTAVTFGCREYDDALLELNDFIMAQGFTPVASAAFAVEHNIVREIGAGRPTAEDFTAAVRFAARAAAKLRTEVFPLPPLAVVGDPNYREYSALPIHPHASSSKCTECGLCASECPVGAIPAATPRKTDKSLCITCMRCTRICPARARALPALELFGAAKLLTPKCRNDKEHQFFL